ncbi:MAG: DsbA family protein [Roseovarius sp.]
MTRPLLPVFAALALAGTAATFAPAPATALDLASMSEAERQIFREEVRAYLLENPEVIMEAVAVLEQREAQAEAEADVAAIRENAEAIFNDGYSWVGGNPEGDITLVEFMDYRCGYCRRAAPEVTDFITFDGNVKLIVKEFPILGEQSVLSSRFAIATKQIAGDEAYESVHDALIAYTSEITQDSLARLGQSLDLDTDAIIAHMDSPEVSAVIAANHQLAQKLGISGTPSFVMENRMLRGYLPREEMEALAEEIRAEG